MRHSVRPGAGLMFQIGMKLHQPQFPVNGRMRGGGKKIRITIQMKLEMPSFDPHLAPTTRQMGAVIPTVSINSSHLTPVHEVVL